LFVDNFLCSHKAHLATGSWLRNWLKPAEWWGTICRWKYILPSFSHGILSSKRWRRQRQIWRMIWSRHIRHRETLPREMQSTVLADYCWQL
jgi:hypothetical protein